MSYFYGITNRTDGAIWQMKYSGHNGSFSVTEPRAVIRTSTSNCSVIAIDNVRRHWFLWCDSNLYLWDGHVGGNDTSHVHWQILATWKQWLMIGGGVDQYQPAAAAYYGDAFWFLCKYENTVHRAILQYNPQGVPSSVSVIQSSTFKGDGVWRKFANPLSMAIQAKTMSLYISSPKGISRVDMRKIIAGQPCDLDIIREIGIGGGDNAFVSLTFDLDEDCLLGQTGGVWGTINLTTGMLTVLNKSMNNLTFIDVTGSLGVSCLAPTPVKKSFLERMGAGAIAAIVVILGIIISLLFIFLTEPGQRCKDDFLGNFVKSNKDHINLEMGEAPSGYDDSGDASDVALQRNVTVIHAERR